MANSITWWDKLKHAVGRYLLASEVAKVEMERTTYLHIRSNLDREIKEFEQEKASYTITDMVREQLHGFDPKLLDNDDDMPGVLDDTEESQDAFLSKMKSLSEHEELRTLIAFLIRNQVLHAAKVAEKIDEMNFARATLNGFTLLMDEIARMAVIYDDKHKKEPDFDEHEVV